MRCSFHSPEAVSYAQAMSNKCFNWSALPFQVADLYLRAHAKLTSYITFELHRFESRDENKTIFPEESEAQ